MNMEKVLKVKMEKVKVVLSKKDVLYIGVCVES